MTSTFHRICTPLRFSALFAVGCLFSPSLVAQAFPDAPDAVVEASGPRLASTATVFTTPSYFVPAYVQPSQTAGSTLPAPEHGFWDRQNSMLFAASAALTGADFGITRANLQNGGQELNPVVRMFGRSSAGLALNFGGETAGMLGLSYFFHRTGHHRMERLVPMVNIAASAGAVTYGLVHR
jgi:hypothetical protein